MYTQEQFIEDVKAEAMALRQHATAEELGRLDFEDLDPEDELQCIYGSGNVRYAGSIDGELCQVCEDGGRDFQAEGDH